MKRKEVLQTGEIYHVFNKSIAGYKIFNNDGEFERIRQLLCYYRCRGAQIQYWNFLKSANVNVQGFYKHAYTLHKEFGELVQIIAFCIMPTHIHLILKQQVNDGIRRFIGNVLNSYARFFNIKHNRKGPLWVGRFKNVRVSSDEQLLHLTRYVHLNPVTAYLVEQPEKWEFSSYQEYVNGANIPQEKKLCAYGTFVEMKPSEYRRFVMDQKDYQRELANIKQFINQ